MPEYNHPGYPVAIYDPDDEMGTTLKEKLGKHVAIVSGVGANSVLREYIREAMRAEEEKRREEEQMMRNAFQDIQKGLSKGMYQHDPAEFNKLKELSDPAPINALPPVTTGPLSRKVQRKVKNKWIDTPFMDLTSGCTFRMFEEDGSPVVDDKGRSEWIASCKPFIKDGVARINVYK